MEAVRSAWEDPRMPYKPGKAQSFPAFSRPMIATPKKQPWLVRMHHRMRTASFAMLFVATSLHISGKSYGLAAWLLLGILLLVYPHVQYLRARRAEDSVSVEMDNLLVDSILLGIYVAALEFPLWISFSAMLGTLSNNAANKGWRGVGETLVALLGGALAWIAVVGFGFSPHTDWPATAFCILGLGGYLLVMSTLGFTRNLQLRVTRETLQLREKELLAANETLLRNIEEIDKLQAKLQEQANREELRAAFGAMVVDFAGAHLQTTLSIGISAYPRHGQSADELLRCADRALYRAKHGGRNRVDVESVGDDQTAKQVR